MMNIRNKQEVTKMRQSIREKAIFINYKKKNIIRKSTLQEGSKSLLYQKGYKDSQWIEYILFVSAMIALLSVLLITFFVLRSGLPLIQKVGIKDFIFGLKWAPTQGSFGIFPMIIGTVMVTLGALVIGIPFGLAGAIFLAEIVPVSVAKAVRPMIELLAGIPSVVYGFFGMIVIVPFLREKLGGTGLGILAGSIILAIMILPTIINIAEDAIRAVPREYKEGSLGMGATHWQTIKKIILPAARSGIISGIVLGMGRAIGETMAVIMVTGNAPVLPNSIMSQVRTLTGNVVLEMGYAAGEHQQALFATGIVLFGFIMILNLVISFTLKKEGESA